MPKEINDKQGLSRRCPIPVPESGQRLNRQSAVGSIFQTNDFRNALFTSRKGTFPWRQSSWGQLVCDPHHVPARRSFTRMFFVPSEGFGSRQARMRAAHAQTRWGKRLLLTIHRWLPHSMANLA